MSERDLFDEASVGSQGSSKSAGGRVRVQRAERRQVELRASCLEDLLPEEHRARALWDAVDDLDLSAFYFDVCSREGSAGRPAIDPKILVALWLYATSEGVGSARELARLCEMHDAYRWLCGGVGVNHHTLSDFRVSKGRALDELLTQILGLLMHEGIVRLRRVAQDGTKVRASAGAASFRRKQSLKECLREAREQVRAAKHQLDSEGGQATKRLQAARVRAAQERRNRVRKALRHVDELSRIKIGPDEKEKVRASTTDPECRVMKMADGGFRPAYNLQFATDVEARVIVGVQVTNRGSDLGQLEPMLEEIGRRTEQLPKEHLVDGGYVKLGAIERAAECGVMVYAPTQQARRTDIDPSKPKTNDGPGVAAWRRRMGSEQAQEIYKDRGATAERTNADLKTWRGLDRLPVRGLGNVLCVALWSAITFNLMRWVECAT
jgi:transposase